MELSKAPLARFFLIIVCLFCLHACGGGGGGGPADDVRAASVNIDADPKDLFVGDRIVVETYIDDVNDKGVVLKFRFPKGLNYVRESSRLEVDGLNVDVGPSNYVTKDTYRYLVFVFPKDVFGDDWGRLKFEIDAADAVGDAKIEVDPALRDPAISNSDQFNVNDPRFGTDIEVKVYVRGEEQ